MSLKGKFAGQKKEEMMKKLTGCMQKRRSCWKKLKEVTKETKTAQGSKKRKALDLIDFSKDAKDAAK